MSLFRRLLCLAVVVVTAMATGQAVSSAGETPKYGGILHDYLGADPPGIDPQVDTTFLIYNLSREIFNTLVRYEKDSLKLEPELLETLPALSADRKTYTCKLRKGVKFHDGTELKAKDVKFTFERMLTPATKAANGWCIEQIVGAQEMMDGKAKELAGFKIIDDYAFQFTLEYPYAPFLSNLAVPAMSIFPEEACKKAGDNWALRPIGTGPFKIDKWVRDSILVLKKHADYFEKGLPYLDAIEMRIIPESATAMLEFENGTIDVTSIPDSDFIRVTTSPAFKDKILSGTPLNIYFYNLNVNDPYLKDVRVRRAFAMAIDKKTLVDKVFTGGRADVASSFLCPGLPGFNPNFPGIEYNPAKARELLKEAGYPNGFTIESWQTKSDTVLRRNEAVQAMLKEVGINLKIVQVDSASYRQARKQGTIPCYFSNWWADIGDPDNFLYVWFHSSQSKGFSSNYSSPKVDALLDRARKVSDAAERIALYQRAEGIIVHDDVAVVPLLYYKDFMLKQPYVKGLTMHPTGVMSYKHVWLDK
ncbi:MAG: ABC transporter substrate-binding protein [Bacillota bacterium]